MAKSPHLKKLALDMEVSLPASRLQWKHVSDVVPELVLLLLLPINTAPATTMSIATLTLILTLRLTLTLLLPSLWL